MASEQGSSGLDTASGDQVSQTRQEKPSLIRRVKNKAKKLQSKLKHHHRSTEDHGQAYPAGPTDKDLDESDTSESDGDGQDEDIPYSPLTSTGLPYPTRPAGATAAKSEDGPVGAVREGGYGAEGVKTDSRLFTENPAVMKSEGPTGTEQAVPTNYSYFNSDPERAKLPSDYQASQRKEEDPSSLGRKLTGVSPAVEKLSRGGEAENPFARRGDILSKSGDRDAEIPRNWETFQDSENDVGLMEPSEESSLSHSVKQDQGLKFPGRPEQDFNLGLPELSEPWEESFTSHPVEQNQEPRSTSHPRTPQNALQVDGKGLSGRTSGDTTTTDEGFDKTSGGLTDVTAINPDPSPNYGDASAETNGEENHGAKGLVAAAAGAAGLGGVAAGLERKFGPSKEDSIPKDEEDHSLERVREPDLKPADDFAFQTAPETLRTPESGKSLTFSSAQGRDSDHDESDTLASPGEFGGRATSDPTEEANNGAVTFSDADSALSSNEKPTSENASEAAFHAGEHTPVQDSNPDEQEKTYIGTVRDSLSAVTSRLPLLGRGTPTSSRSSALEEGTSTKSSEGEKDLQADEFGYSRSSGRAAADSTAVAEKATEDPADFGANSFSSANESVTFDEKPFFEKPSGATNQPEDASVQNSEKQERTYTGAVRDSLSAVTSRLPLLGRGTPTSSSSNDPEDGSRSRGGAAADSTPNSEEATDASADFSANTFSVDDSVTSDEKPFPEKPSEATFQPEEDNSVQDLDPDKQKRSYTGTIVDSLTSRLPLLGRGTPTSSPTSAREDGSNTKSSERLDNSLEADELGHSGSRGRAAADSAPVSEEARDGSADLSANAFSVDDSVTSDEKPFSEKPSEPTFQPGEDAKQKRTYTGAIVDSLSGVTSRLPLLGKGTPTSSPTSALDDCSSTKSSEGSRGRAGADSSPVSEEATDGSADFSVNTFSVDDSVTSDEKPFPEKPSEPTFQPEEDASVQDPDKQKRTYTGTIVDSLSGLTSRLPLLGRGTPTSSPTSAREDGSNTKSSEGLDNSLQADELGHSVSRGRAVADSTPVSEESTDGSADFPANTFSSADDSVTADEKPSFEKSSEATVHPEEDASVQDLDPEKQKRTYTGAIVDSLSGVTSRLPFLGKGNPTSSPRSSPEDDSSTESYQGRENYSQTDTSDYSGGRATSDSTHLLQEKTNGDAVGNDSAPEAFSSADQALSSDEKPVSEKAAEAVFQAKEDMPVQNTNPEKQEKSYTGSITDSLSVLTSKLPLIRSGTPASSPSSAPEDGSAAPGSTDSTLETSHDSTDSDAVPTSTTPTSDVSHDSMSKEKRSDHPPPSSPGLFNRVTGIATSLFGGGAKHPAAEGETRTAGR